MDMKRLDLELLHAFVTVVEAGSLSAAAPRLFRSQSAVSEQIRKLELVVGVALLSRSKAGVVPTPAGQRFLSHARALLDLGEAAMRDARGDRLAGELRFAITEYFRPSALTSILKRIQTLHPHLRLHVSMQRSIEIESAAKENQLDIAITMRVTDPRARGRADPCVQLGSEGLCWVAGAGFALDETKPLPLILLPPTCALHGLVLRALERSGTPFYIAHTASGMAGAQQALVAGLGVSCLNELAVPAQATILKRIGGLPKMPDIEFSLLPGRADESPLVAQVRAMLVQQFTA